jgi:hypothetical protein
MEEREATTPESGKDLPRLPLLTRRLSRGLGPKPEPYTEAELDWGYQLHHRFLLFCLASVAFTVVMVAVVVIVGDLPVYLIPAGVLFAGFYALTIRRALRKLPEAVEKRRAQLRAFLDEHP